MSDETPVSGREPLQGSSAAVPRSRATAKAGRRMPVLVALAALVVIAIVAVVGLMLRTSGASTPQGSLKLMAQAAADKDWGGVKRYVDVDSVATDFADAAIASAFGGSSNGSGGSSSSMRGTGISGSRMAPKAVAGITGFIERGIKEGTGAGSGGLTGVFYVATPKSVTLSSETEALATVSIRVSAGDTRDVELRMKKAGDHWRIVEFVNAGQLVDLPF